jgi:hypothetical protein
LRPHTVREAALDAAVAGAKIFEVLAEAGGQRGAIGRSAHAVVLTEHACAEQRVGGHGGTCDGAIGAQQRHVAQRGRVTIAALAPWRWLLLLLLLLSGNASTAAATVCSVVVASTGLRGAALLLLFLLHGLKGGETGKKTQVDWVRRENGQTRGNT